MRPGAAAKAEVRLDIQGLRAVAVALVLLDHVFGSPRGGFIGVDVFFCISGFLITGLLVREKNGTGRISIRDFYARRARRILPMAVLVLVATNVAARLLFLQVRVHQTFVDSLWALGFAANVHFANIGTNYFDLERPQSALQQYWSLAVEEQFYLIWPCLLLVAFLVARAVRVRRPLLVAGVAATVVTGASLAFSVTYTASHPVESYFSAFTRAWELGLGALAMVVHTRFSRLPERLRAVANWIGLAGIVAAAFVIDPATPFPGSAALVPVLATALILCTGPAQGGLGARWALGSWPAQYVGRISYSLYLWHWPALIFANTYFGQGTATARATAAGAALGLSALSSGLVEEPIRHSQWLMGGGRGYGRQRRNLTEWTYDNERVLLPMSAAATVVAVWFAWTVAFAPGTPVVEAASSVALGPSTTVAEVATDSSLQEVIKASVFTKSWGQLAPSLEELPDAAAPEITRDGCMNIDDQNKARCVYGPAHGQHLAVMLGDSIAGSYVPGVREVLNGAGWKLQMLTASGCSIIDAPMNVSREHAWSKERCLSHREWAIREVQRLKPELVIISGNFKAVNALVGAEAEGSLQNYAMWREAMTRSLTRVGAGERRVVVLGAPPRSKSLQQCVTRVSRPADCLGKPDRDWFGVRDAEKAAAAATGATHVDPLDWFCYQSNCPAVIGSTPVYWDGIHMTAVFSRSLAPRLSTVLLA